jgi:glutathionylspermidine amidase/synthetase
MFFSALAIVFVFFLIARYMVKPENRGSLCRNLNVSIIITVSAIVILSFWLTSQYKSAHRKDVAPFGTVLGITHGETEVYSCDYASADPVRYPDDDAYVMYYNGTFTGIRYQCVELARRYLLINHGVVFDPIDMAYQIFDLSTVRRVMDSKRFAMRAIANGSEKKPEKGSLVIWADQGEFHTTGHVAVVVGVTDWHVDIAEQNVEDRIWPRTETYSRRLKFSMNTQGQWEITCTYSNSRILGWMKIDLNTPIEVSLLLMLNF